MLESFDPGLEGFDGFDPLAMTLEDPGHSAHHSEEEHFLQIEYDVNDGKWALLLLLLTDVDLGADIIYIDTHICTYISLLFCNIYTSLVVD